VTPDAVVDSVADIGLDLLRRWQIEGVVLDLDNTIVAWHRSEVTPAAQRFVQLLHSAGLKICLLTNNYGAHARTVADAIGAQIVRAALKPLPGGFRRALASMQVTPQTAVAIGDQLFTDVLGAKLVGMRAILVMPVAQREFLTTRFLRWLERPIVERLKRERR
jgi:HAD superfamily phosphatase (TIGR01668 family)